jgi:hypothetical protein
MRQPNVRLASNIAALPPLLDRLCEHIRHMHGSLQTERGYVHSSRAFIRFYSLRHPLDMGQVEVEGVLMQMEVERCVAPSSHWQAFLALLFADEVASVLSHMARVAVRTPLDRLVSK